MHEMSRWERFWARIGLFQMKVHHKRRHGKVSGPWWFEDCDECQAEARADLAQYE